MNFWKIYLLFLPLTYRISWKMTDSMKFFIFFAFQQYFHNPHNSLSFNHLHILLNSHHKISSNFFTKNSNFSFHRYIYNKTIIIMMTIFFILYFITIYLLIAVYPFFIKGMVQLVNDISRIAQFIILFIFKSICLIDKKIYKDK